MKVVNITAANFMSFKDFSLDIPDNGLIFVGGEVKGSAVTSSNGAGKSALFEALCWGMFGSTLRGSTSGEVANWSAPRNCRVQVMFLDDHNDLYTVIRYRNSKDYGNALYLYKDEEDLTGASSKVTQETIESLAGMSWLVFSTAVVFGEKATRFTEARDAEKKAVFDEILMLQRYQEAQRRVREELKELRNDRVAINAQLLAAEQASEATSRELAALEEESAQLEQSNESSQGRVATIDRELQKLAASTRETETQLRDTQREREQLDADNKEMNAAISKADHDRLAAEDKAKRPGLAKRVEVQGLENQLADLDKRIKSARSLRGKDKCPTCLQPFDEHSAEGVVSHYQEQQRVVNDQLTLAKAELIKLHEAERKATAEARKLLDDVMAVKSDLDSRMRQKVTAITTLTAKLRDLNYQTSTLGRERDALMVRYEERRRSLDEQLARTAARAEQFMTDHECKQMELGASMEQELYLKFWEDGFGNQGIKSFLMDEILPSLNDRIAYYAEALLGDNTKIEFDTESTLKSGGVRDKFDIRITRDRVKVDYTACSNGERRRIDVAILLALQSLVYERNAAGCNLMVLDEVFDSLDRVGIEKVVGLLAEEAKDKTIYVISHLNEMRDYFEQEVIVTKTDGVSEVVL